MVVVEGVARGLDPDFDIWEASRPVVERFMLDQLSPQARLREMGETVVALGRAVQKLPQFMQQTDAIAQMLAEGGLKLHPDSEQRIANAGRTDYGLVWALLGFLVGVAVLSRFLAG